MPKFIHLLAFIIHVLIGSIIGAITTGFTLEALVGGTPDGSGIFVGLIYGIFGNPVIIAVLNITVVQNFLSYNKALSIPIKSLLTFLLFILVSGVISGVLIGLILHFGGIV